MSGAARLGIAALAFGAALGVAQGDTPMLVLPGLLAGGAPHSSHAPDPTADDSTEKAQYAVPTRTDRSGRIIAPVMINGLGPFRFMVDTGSNRTVLAQSTLAKLGMSADANTPIAVSAISGSQLAPSIHVAALDAGDLHFREIDVPVLTGPVFNGLDGILGMDGFNGMRVFADFDKDRMTISQSQGKRPSFSYSVMHVEFLSERLLMVDAKVGRVSAKAIIDTGSAHTLANRALLEALTGRRQDGPRAEHAGVIDVTQLSRVATIGRVPELRLGEVDIRDLDIVFADFRIFSTWGLKDEPALLVGMDVLGTIKALDIDYRRREVSLLPRTPADSLLQRLDTKSFSFGTR